MDWGRQLSFLSKSPWVKQIFTLLVIFFREYESMEFKSKWGSLVTIFRPTESDNDNDDNNLKRSIWMLGSVLWSRKVFSSAESRASWGRSHRSEVWWMGNNMYWFWMIPFTWTWLEVHQYLRHNSTLKLSKKHVRGIAKYPLSFLSSDSVTNISSTPSRNIPIIMYRLITSLRQ